MQLTYVIILLHISRQLKTFCFVFSSVAMHVIFFIGEYLIENITLFAMLNMTSLL